MNRCLVTGGAGFIGSHVVDLLVAQGWKVSVLDNLSFGRWSNIETHGDLVERIEGDIVDADLVERTLSEGRFRRIVHLAAIHFIPYCNAHPQLAIRTNIEGTENILQSAGGSGVQEVFLASSAAVYPDVSGPIAESTPTHPMDVYGATKVANEHQARFHCARIPRVIAGRFFNAVGGRETNPHLVPELVRRTALADTIPIGNTTPRRDYIDVRDLAESICRLLSVPGEGFETWNIGTGLSHDVVEVVAAISRIRGRKIELAQDSALVRKVERENLQADITRLETRLGWRPGRNLDAMIAYATESSR